MKTLADIKRTMVLGSKWHCWNHLYNYDMGVRPVSKVCTEFVTFETVRDDGEIVHSAFRFPKACEIRFSDDGQAFTVFYSGKDRLSYRLARDGE